MVRARSKKDDQAQEPSVAEARREARMDVNAIVSYNLRTIRERRGWTQQSVAERLAVLTKHQLPQASISAMERGFDGDRRRRFDAHELYLLSVVFKVPLVYFFLPPPKTGLQELADTERPVSELYAAVLGRDWELADLDERLADLNVTNPEEVDDVLAALFGAEGAAGNWHDHFRTWRKKRLAKLASTYGDQLDEVAEFLAEFALQIKSFGPKAYLQSKAHRRGEELLDDLDGAEEDD
jgi:transcriptional regulator with XRE-family HTH domain